MKTKGKRLWIIGIISLVVIVTLSYGFYRIYAVAKTIAQVINTKEPDPPKVDIVLTHATSSLKIKPPSLFIYNFETQSDDNQPWGSMCSRILSIKLNYAPHEFIYIPPTIWIIRDLMRSTIISNKLQPISQDMETYLAHSYGVDNLLHGTIHKNGISISFQGKLINLSTNSTIAKIEENGTMSEPQDFFNKLAQKIAASLGVPSDDSAFQYLNQMNTGNSESLLQALKAFSATELEDKDISDLYAQAFEKDPNFLFAYIGAADRIADTQIANAMDILNRAKKQFPNNTLVQIFRAFVYQSSGKYSDAIQTAEDVLQTEPENHQALAIIASSSGSSGDLAKALDFSRKEVDFYPDSWISLGDYAYFAMSLGDSARKGRYFNKMSTDEQKVFTNNMYNAYLATQKTYKIHPKSIIVLNSVLNIYKENGADLVEIEEAFAKVTTLAPHDIQAYKTMQWVYGKGYYNEPQKAIQILENGFNNNSDNLDYAYLILDRVAWDEGKKDAVPLDPNTVQKAQDLIKEFAQKNPNNEYLGWRMAEFYYDHKKYPEAWAYYERLKDLSDEDGIFISKVYIHKAWTAKMLNKYPIVVEYADKCLDAAPNEKFASEAYILKAMCIFKENQIEKGFEFLDIAIQRNPEDGYTNSQYAHYAVYYKNHLDKGLESINKALSLDPQNAKYHAILSEIYLAKNEKSLALKEINKALELEPDNTYYKDFKKKIP